MALSAQSNTLDKQGTLSINLVFKAAPWVVDPNALGLSFGLVIAKLLKYNLRSLLITHKPHSLETVEAYPSS